MAKLKRQVGDNRPSKLARFTFLGMAPVLVPLRPSAPSLLVSQG